LLEQQVTKITLDLSHSASSKVHRAAQLVHRAWLTATSPRFSHVSPTSLRSAAQFDRQLWRGLSILVLLLFFDAQNMVCLGISE